MNNIQFVYKPKPKHKIAEMADKTRINLICRKNIKNLTVVENTPRYTHFYISDTLYRKIKLFKFIDKPSVDEKDLMFLINNSQITNLDNIPYYHKPYQYDYEYENVKYTKIQNKFKTKSYNNLVNTKYKN